MANMSAFGAALATVASKVVTGQKFIYNIAQQRNYASLYYFYQGRRMSDMLRAGSDVRARVKFTAGSQADWYSAATAEHPPSISEDGAWAIAYWCAHMAHESWKEEELLINSGGVTEGSLAEETWTQELWNKYQSLMTALHGSLAATFWRRPSNADMNGTDPLRPCSIPVYLNPMTNGLFVEDASTTWTTIHGIAPATNTGYVPYRGTYGSFTSTDSNSLVYALSLAMRMTTFAPPPVNQEYFVPEDDGEMENDKGVVFASATGVTRAEHSYRGAQDRWSDAWDPFGNPRFKGCQLVHEAQLDTAAIHPDASGYGNSTETTADITGPRYYGVNTKYMKAYFHRSRFLKFLETFRIGQTTWQQGVNSLGTMLCPDRSKHFLLSPSQDL